MSILRMTGMVVIGTLALLAGCVAVEDEPLGTARQAGGNDHTNGVDPDMAAVCWGELLSAMSDKLVENGELAESVGQSLYPGEKCGELLDYAYACAGAAGTTLPEPATSYTGDHILSTATGWRDGGGLSNLQKQDVLTCLAALLNPNEEEVHVCLSGASVSPGSCLGYSISEAVFKARLTRTGVEFDVWPLAPAELCDATALHEALAERLCNGHWSECHFHVRFDLGTACTLVGTEYNCGGPAIRTQLSLEDYLTMYPGCSVPPQ